MKSIVLFGSLTHQKTYHLTDELQSFQLANETISIGGPIMDMAHNFATLQFETHCILKIGSDIESLECKDQLESKGVFTQAIQTSTPMPSELIIATPTNQYTILSSTASSSFLPTDRIPFVSFDHCDYGLLHEFNEEFLSVLLSKTPKIKWIFNHGFPNANLLKYIHGVILNESEFEKHSKGFTKELMSQMMVNAGMKWILILFQHEVYLYNEHYEDFSYPNTLPIGVSNELRQSFIAHLVHQLSLEVSIETAIEHILMSELSFNQKVNKID